MASTRQPPVNHVVDGLDSEVNGFLLNDGLTAREVGKADVVWVVVQGEHVGKVEVAILAHCHMLILFDVQDLAVHSVDPEQLCTRCEGQQGRIRLPFLYLLLYPLAA